MAKSKLKRSFKSRVDLINYVSEQFPEAAARDDSVSPIKGGRKAALRQLEKLEPVKYGSTRNQLKGAVSRLSPYLRHGVLSLAEVRDKATDLSGGKSIYKYVNELSWRDYFVRVYDFLGDKIWQDFGPYKTGLPLDAYAEDLPQDLRDAETGAVCIDSFVRDLYETGYLHNRQRLYMAAYVVHFRRVRWQAGASWFLEHLLDGDPSSNNLGWQWVASTWRHKPYVWNRANFVKNGGKPYCESCPLLDNGCPFQKTYQTLNAELFEKTAPHKSQKGHGIDTSVLKEVPSEPLPTPSVSKEETLVWVHGDGMNPEGPVLSAYPDAPSVWVWDEELLESYDISLKRLVFLYESLLELPVTIRRGDVAEQIIEVATENDAKVIATTPSPSPRFDAIVKKLEERFEVQVWPEAPFIAPQKPLNLGSHAKYWWPTKSQAFQTTESLKEANDFDK